MAEELAVVFPHAGPAGGVERVVLELLRHSGARRPTRFVGRTMAGVLPGVHHDVVDPGRGARGFRRAAAATLARARPDTTITHGVECPAGDVLWVHSVHAAWLADGGRLAVRGHAVPPMARRLLPRHRTLLRLEERYFTRSSPRAILCTSAREAADLHRLYGVPTALTHVVPNGVDGAVFSPDRARALRPDARRSIGAGADDIVVLMVANEWHRKGLATLLEAVALVDDRRLRVDLVGRHDPGDYRGLARRLGVRMAWHGVAADVARFYAAADVFALPTSYEPFGIAVIEAMAMGLPVVVSALAGAAVAVRPGHSGLLLADPRDSTELRSAVGLLTEPDARVAMGGAAAVRARRYDWNIVLAEVDTLVFPASAGPER